MESLNILMENYHAFEEKRIIDRFFKHDDLLKILDTFRTNSAFNLKEVGLSTNKLSINLITWGNGPIRIFLWSQMHGDEATATMALLIY